MHKDIIFHEKLNFWGGSNFVVLGPTLEIPGLTELLWGYGSLAPLNGFWGGLPLPLCLKKVKTIVFIYSFECNILFYSSSAFFTEIVDRKYSQKTIGNYKTLEFTLSKESESSKPLTLLRQRPLSYRNQSIDLRSKSMDWFLYDNGLRLERVNSTLRRLIH